MRTYVYGAETREPVLHPQPDVDVRLVDLLQVEEDEDVWILDEEEPLEIDLTLRVLFVERAHVRLMRHRCHRVTVSISYNGRSVGFEVPPSRTVDALLNKAITDPALGIDHGSATDFELREPGADTGLDPTLPIGALTTPGHCRISLILAASGRSAG